jgi:peptidoglycan hydrolase-like protein with peptidoglycan-binding domain
VSRAIVLILCLAAAGAVAAYTHYSQNAGEQTPVFTVHAPDRNTGPAAPVLRPVQPSHRANLIPGDRASLVRELQRELKRVGCYSGDVNGVWTTSSRMAMKSVTDRVNATLPIDNPDDVLLSLVRGQQDGVCGVPCPTGQSTNDRGRCPPSAVLAKGPVDVAPPEAKAEPQVDKSSITTGSIVPATAAAATALAASAAIPRAEPKANLPENRARPAAVTPEETSPKSGRIERSSRQSGPLPFERVYESRTRRTSNTSRPPKFIRNVLRAFGIR